MRAGVLGGTFDPVHLGHLRAAEEVGEALDLDKVYLIPAALPPHKEVIPLTPFDRRFEMLCLAVGDDPLLQPFDLESRRLGISYSIDSLKELHALHPPDLDLFFIIGLDAFIEIKTWKAYKSLFDFAHFVVIGRPGTHVETFEPFLFSIGLPFKQEGAGPVFLGPSGNRVIFKETSAMDISSTRIREMVRQGRSIRFLVPEEVRRYIMDNGLYRVHEND